MATDLTQPPLEILVDLINDTNGCSLTTSDITFSPPMAIINGNRNTGLTITATPNSIYSGFRDVTYNRIDLASLPGARSTDFAKGIAITARNIIAAINYAYGTNLQDEDFYDDPLPTFDGSDPGEFKSFILRAKPGSFIYRGTLELIILPDAAPLNDLLGTSSLHGFAFPGLSNPA